MLIFMDKDSKERFLRITSYLVLAFTIAAPVQADLLPEPWQSQREESIEITDRACNGHDHYIAEVSIRLGNSDPAMMNNSAWLQANCKPFSDLTLDEVTNYQIKSALLGYPIAMDVYGVILLYGDRGVERDVSTGVSLLERSIEAGYGKAAVHLAHAYSKGEVVPRDIERARDLLAIAESENVSPDLLDSLRKLISVAEGEENSQASEAPGSSKETKLTGELVTIPAGSFQMGCHGLGDVGVRGCSRFRNDKPIHGVTLQAFKMQAHEVTWDQYQLCVDAGGCSSPWGGDRGWGEGDRPVIEVTWDDIQKYIEWLNTQGVGTFRLPSEAEWEYAARAGEATNYHWGNSASTSKANYEKAHGKTMPVKSYAPNAWGLYDMHGNVSERVQDCWNDTYEGAPGNGQAWLSGTCKERVIRGGSWSDAAVNIRSDARHRFKLSSTNSHVGFRLVKDR